MVSWDGWEAEIRERIAELTNEQPSPESVPERGWKGLVRLWQGAARGITRQRAT
jgi:hypothetical protein